MNTRRVYIYFALTFLLGVLAGAAGAFYCGWQMMGPQGRPARRERILRHLTRELDLNSSQVEQVRAIMEETGGKIDALRKQQRPEFDALLAESRDRVRKILTPQQATQFDEMMKKFEERRKRREESQGPPGTPPPD